MVCSSRNDTITSMNLTEAPWTITSDFFKEGGVGVGPYHKGVEIFNTLECYEVGEDKLLLRREAKGDPDRTVFAEFKRQMQEGSSIVTATFRMIVPNEEELRQLRLREEYKSYDPAGVKQIGRITYLRMISARNIVLNTYLANQGQKYFRRAMFNFENGSLKLDNNTHL